MEPAQLAAFALRDRTEVESLKSAFWKELHASRGPASGLRAADQLRRQAKVLHPDWPNEQERADDLDIHLRVSECLRRVRFPGR